MTDHQYFEKKKEIQNNILSFLDNEEDEEENFENLIKSIKEQQILENKHEFKLLLKQIEIIASNHIRRTNFFNKIERILLYAQNSIKDTFTNLEIYDIFQNNKRILLFLLEEKMIILNESIVLSMHQLKHYKSNFEYFRSECKPFLNDSILNICLKSLENLGMIDEDSFNKIQEYYVFHLLSDEQIKNFKNLRKIGENDDYICELIRKDLIEEFIIYVNKTDYSLNSMIKDSIFETNNLLINRGLSLIEYASFFGSVQIFKYLFLNGAEWDKYLWLFAIHGDNPEIFAFLEEKGIIPNQLFSGFCLNESIKCHHNDVANYILNNYFKDDIDLFYDACLRYQNYILLPNDFKSKRKYFFYSKYGYFTLLESILKSERIYEHCEYSYYKCMLNCAAQQNNYEILELLLDNTIDNIVFEKAFIYCDELTKINIPSTITSIEKGTFENCKNLREILIPPTITIFKKNAFYGCSFLNQITIPNSVTEIEEGAFSECLYLKNIEIPSSVTSIGKYAFYNCISLEKIENHSSIDVIEEGVFSKCESLKNLPIPPSVKYLGKHAFSKCKSLSNISLPSSIEIIGKFAFYDCNKLNHIDIPSSVTLIEEGAFCKCSNLKEITLPSSINTINNGVFSECISLQQVLLNSSIGEIGDYAFSKCSALKTIEIPSSVSKIKEYAFYRSSLNQICLPSSVSSIEKFAFYECDTLNKVVICSKKAVIGWRAFGRCDSLNKISAPFDIDYYQAGIITK